MKNQTPTRMDDKRGLKGSNTWLDSWLGCLGSDVGAFKKVGEQGRGRFVPEKRQAVAKTRGRGHPRPMLERARDPGELLSVLPEGLFEHLL